MRNLLYGSFFSLVVTPVIAPSLTDQNLFVTLPAVEVFAVEDRLEFRLVSGLHQRECREANPGRDGPAW